MRRETERIRRERAWKPIVIIVVIWAYPPPKADSKEGKGGSISGRVSRRYSMKCKNILSIWVTPEQR